MTFLVDRLAELRRHLDHLADLRQRPAVRNLVEDDRFPSAMVDALVRLPGFRNVVIHDYVVLDLDRVMDALNALDPVEQFLTVVVDIERLGA